MLLTPLSLGACLLVSSVAALTDLRTRTIPNWLTLPVPSFALAAHSVSFGLEGAMLAVLGCVLCFLPAYFMFARGALGGGDVKLFAGLGALLGAREGLEIQLAAFALVALYALSLTAWRGQLRRLLGASYHATLHLIAPSRFPRQAALEQAPFELPMGGAILLAALALCVRSAL